MKITAINSVQQNKTSKQSFGILKPVQMTDEFHALLKGEGDAFIGKLEQTLRKIGDQQAHNNSCDMELFMGYKSPFDLPIPAVDITDKAGVLIAQVHVNQKKLVGLETQKAVILALETASTFATKFLEKEIKGIK